MHESQCVVVSNRKECISRAAADKVGIFYLGRSRGAMDGLEVEFNSVDREAAIGVPISKDR